MIARVSEIELHDEITQWLDSLDDAEWDRAVVVIDRLATLGPSARMPLSRSLGGALFELRFALGPTARRITYRFTKDGRIILIDDVPQATPERTSRDRTRQESGRRLRAAEPVKETTMANYSRWEDLKKHRGEPAPAAPRRSNRTSRSAS